jgi:hypothetical protein
MCFVLVPPMYIHRSIKKKNLFLPKKMLQGTQASAKEHCVDQYSLPLIYDVTCRQMSSILQDHAHVLVPSILPIDLLVFRRAISNGRKAKMTVT